jgi:hypothetical protein
MSKPSVNHPQIGQERPGFFASALVPQELCETQGRA